MAHELCGWVREGLVATGTVRYTTNRHARTYVPYETFFPGDFYESPQDQAGTYFR